MRGNGRMHYSFCRGTKIPTSSVNPRREGVATAKFNFRAKTPMELSLVKGEQLYLVRRVDRNWYEGRIGERRGIIPVSYVDVALEPGAALAVTPNRGSSLQLWL